MSISTDSLTKLKTDSLEKAKKDSIRWATLDASLSFPVIKAGKWSGVLPVKNVEARPDTSLSYKLLINLTLWDRDSAHLREVNDGLSSIGRLINLHVSSGVPKENLDIVVVTHGGALNVFLTDSAYRKKFRQPNPNLETIKKLASLKVKFMGCGQAEEYLNITRDDVVPELKTAHDAQTMLSYYQLKGYVLFALENEK
jgi:intracellular sulfur oxidation DsrE/DsrF family protein